MPPSRSNFSPIYKKNEEIKRNRGIQAAEEPLLQDRLVLVFTAPKMQQRRPGGLKNHDLVRGSRQRKARRIYLDVLRKSPDIFIAFILTITPRRCVVFDAPAFLHQHKNDTISLSESFRSLVWEVAGKHGFQNCSDFRQWVSSMSDLSPPPTEAQGTNNCLLELGDLGAIRLALGDTISDAIEQCPTHRPTLSDGSGMTEWVWTNIPYNAYQDAIVHINVGSACKLAETLFPFASYKINLLLSESPLANERNYSKIPWSPEMSPQSKFPNLGMQIKKDLTWTATNCFSKILRILLCEVHLFLE